MNRLAGLLRLRQLGTAVAAAVAAELCGVGLMATAAWLIVRAAQRPPLAVLGVAIAAVRGFAIFRGVFRYAERLAGHNVALRAAAALRPIVYAATARAQRRHTGETLTTMVSDVDSVRDLVLRAVLPLAVSVTVASASVAVCAAMLPSAAAVLAAGLLLAGLALPAATAIATGRAGRRLTAARAALAEASLDLVDGAWELAAYDATDSALATVDGQVADLALIERRMAAVASTAHTVGTLLHGLTVAGVLVAALDARLDPSTVAVLGFLALAAFEPVLQLPDAARHTTMLGPAAARLAALLTGSQPAGADPPAPPVVRSPDRILLSGVRVAFASVALDGVDVRIDPGSSVAVVGPNGAGKSTLLAVIAGLVAPQAGTVATPWACGLLQDAHLFDTTIRANLMLARPGATDAQLAGAARTAGVLDWIESLPDSWDTVVGAGGRNLSGGQRQRLAIARALLAEPPVMLLDEPSEALERPVADELVRNVLRERTGRTTVVVTHRLACASMFDEVLVLDRGRIAQRGHHDQLVSTAGLYRALWSAERLAA